MRTASGFRARNDSPDSVIYTLDSNFTLFSSASASVERCSFASDAHDRDSLASSDVSIHLPGHEGGSEQDESRSGLDPNKIVAMNRNSKQSHSNTIYKEDSNVTAVVDNEDFNRTLDSARSSFSLAVKECRNGRSRSEAVSKRPERRRPASLDLNSIVAASSPRMGVTRKNSTSSRKSGTFPSPGMPNYRLSSVGMQKGWSSERVPLHANGNRYQTSATFLPNGRTLPSKWADAERWIFSPISGDVGASMSFPLKERRPKSKSGPLGAPGVAYYSLHSPTVPVLDGGHLGGSMASSPFSAGVISVNRLAINTNGHGLNFPVQTQARMARSVSVHGCSEMVSQSSLPSREINYQEEKPDDVKDGATDISRTVSRRDMATQMSPEGSDQLSPARMSSLSASTPVVANAEVLNIHALKSEVRDVQVDGRVTVTRSSKKHKSRNHWKISEIMGDRRKNTADTQSSAWGISETSKSISKANREEAKITAWENLQKAKAEAAIRKLEMKLEKKRSSSMDKIIGNLRSAQKRAQEMRNKVLANQVHQQSKNSYKTISFRKTRQLGAFTGCFCHAFKVS